LAALEPALGSDVAREVATFACGEKARPALSEAIAEARQGAGEPPSKKHRKTTNVERSN